MRPVHHLCSQFNNLQIQELIHLLTLLLGPVANFQMVKVDTMGKRTLNSTKVLFLGPLPSMLDMSTHFR